MKKPITPVESRENSSGLDRLVRSKHRKRIAFDSRLRASSSISRCCCWVRGFPRRVASSSSSVPPATLMPPCAGNMRMECASLGGGESVVIARCSLGWSQAVVA